MYWDVFMPWLLWSGCINLEWLGKSETDGHKESTKNGIKIGGWCWISFDLLLSGCINLEWLIGSTFAFAFTKFQKQSFNSKSFDFEAKNNM